MNIFYRYFQLKNKSIALLFIDFLVENNDKILSLKFTELITTSYLAEGEERDSTKQTTHFFKIAKASNAEVYTQLHIAHKIGYINDNTLKKLEAKSNMIGSGLYKLIKSRGGYNFPNSIKGIFLSLFA